MRQDLESSIIDKRARNAARSILALLVALWGLGLPACVDDGRDGAPGAQGDPGPAGPPGPAPDAEPTTAVETCLGCHGETGVAPVADITDPDDVHYVDTDPDGPLTPSGYRRLVVTITQVDLIGTRVIIDYTVVDEAGDPVTDHFSSDGRFSIARLDPPASLGSSNTWVSLITRIETPTPGVGTGDGSNEIQATTEAFTSSGATFQNLGAGAYRYSSRFNPTSIPVMAGDTLRVAIQISAGDLPAVNGWCDFDANLMVANDCVSPVSDTRDIVQTATCNVCHGETNDVRLALHGGGRTEVEYCVTCHNPGTKDANSENVLDMKVYIHKIHYGSSLTKKPYQIWGFGNELRDFSTITYTKDIDDCTNCHTGAGADVDNWSQVPTIEACGSCHDDVNFATGANHVGGVQTNNSFCVNCHPQAGVRTAVIAPVETVHYGVARRTEAAHYTGIGNGYQINNLAYNSTSRLLTVDYSVVRDGIPMNLQTDPQWTALANGASRLHFSVGWDTAAADYTNRGSGANPSLPVDINALDFTSATSLGGGVYRVTKTLPSAVSGTVTVAMDGHPAADLDANGSFDDRIAVTNVLSRIKVAGGRAVLTPRRAVVDVANCNTCHGEAGRGISLHGSNRTGNIEVCTVCHNPNNTDINRRPADPAMALDGKKEESIDMKRMVHRIHTGAESAEGFVLYGFGGTAFDFSHVDWIGNRRNCQACHLPGTYQAEDADAALPSTIDTGADRSTPDDDLNISPIAAVCSACHDNTKAKDHMELHGASFAARDADIQ